LIPKKLLLTTWLARGIGRGVAEDLASKGWKVVILDYNSTEGPKTAEKIKGDFFQVDVRSWSAQFHAFDKTFEKYGRLDLGAISKL
jgi:NAD(P)-dependent dehydrogenase (short-subunit alcohol dehydrogenase family)